MHHWVVLPGIGGIDGSALLRLFIPEADRMIFMFLGLNLFHCGGRITRSRNHGCVATGINRSHSHALNCTLTPFKGFSSVLFIMKCSSIIEPTNEIFHKPGNIVIFGVNKLLTSNTPFTRAI